jgi:hypothetical protein
MNSLVIEVYGVAGHECARVSLRRTGRLAGADHRSAGPFS